MTMKDPVTKSLWYRERRNENLKYFLCGHHYVCNGSVSKVYLDVYITK